MGEYRQQLKMKFCFDLRGKVSGVSRGLSCKAKWTLKSSIVSNASRIMSLGQLGLDWMAYGHFR